MRAGPFLLEASIGQGGMGTVYRARHADLSVPVAVKLLPPVHSDPVTRAAFSAEIQALARLEHPNIAMIFDHGILEPNPHFPEGAGWLAMELCSGSLLEDASRFRGWTDTRGVLLSLLEALAFAHARGIVHRDLKLSNVLMSRADDIRPGLKLVDFGIALLDGPGGNTTPAGTPAYMPPEQWSERTSACGPWTDVYAVAVMAWRLVTGQSPFGDRKSYALFHAKCTGHLEPFQPKMAVPPGLEHWLEQCLIPDPAGRFQCVPDALHAFLRLDEAVGPPLARSFLSTEDTATVPVDAAAFDELDFMTAKDPPPPAAPIPSDVAWSLPPMPPRGMAGVGLSLLPFREPPFVGRGALRRSLWSHAQAVDGGASRTLCLVGAPGVGTTAVARWLMAACRTHSGALAAGVRAIEGEPPGASVVRLMESLLRVDAVSTDERVEQGQEALKHWRCSYRAANAALVPLLTSESLSAEARVEGALGVIRALSRVRTTVLVLDGLDHSAGLVELAAALEREAVPGVLTVGVGGERHPGEAVAVGSLPSTAVEAALGYLLPLDGGTVARLIHAASGRPGWAVRMLKDAVAEGRVQPSGRGYTVLPPQDDVTDLAVRFGFDDAAQSAVMRAAILGPVVERAVWASATPEMLPPVRAEIEARLIESGVAETLPGGWTFTRADVVRRLRSAIPEEVTVHHRRCARALEAAGDALRASRCWLRAGNFEAASKTALDHEIAMVAQHGSVAVLEWFRELCAHARDVPLVESIHGELWSRVLVYLRVTDQRDVVRSEARDMAEHCAALGWKNAAGMAYWNWSLALNARPAEALAMVERGLEVSAGGSDRLVQALLRYRLSDDLRRVGRSDEGQAEAERALALFRELDTRAARRYALRIARDMAFARADWGEALHHAEEASRFARSMNSHRLHFCLTRQGELLAFLGRHEEAREVLLEAATAARLYAPRSGLKDALANLGFVAARMGRWEEVVPRMEAVLQLEVEEEGPVAMGCLLLLTAARAQLGRWSGVQRNLYRVLAWLDGPHPPDHDTLMALEALSRAAAEKPELKARLERLVEAERALLTG